MLQCHTELGWDISSFQWGSKGNLTCRDSSQTISFPCLSSNLIQSAFSLKETSSPIMKILSVYHKLLFGRFIKCQFKIKKSIQLYFDSCTFSSVQQSQSPLNHGYFLCIDGFTHHNSYYFITMPCWDISTKLVTLWWRESVGKTASPRPVAQLVEHRVVVREVMSSPPAGPTLRVLK